MNSELENPFQSIESAHQFVTLLAATVVKARRELEIDIKREELTPSRRLNVLRVALFNVKKLEGDINRSRKLLNDLRTLLFEERMGVSSRSTSSEAMHSETDAAA